MHGSIAASGWSARAYACRSTGDRPGERKITLSVIRHLASRPEQRIGSLFVNFGGPGVPGVATVRGGGAIPGRACAPLALWY